MIILFIALAQVKFWLVQFSSIQFINITLVHWRCSFTKAVVQDHKVAPTMSFILKRQRERKALNVKVQRSEKALTCCDYSLKGSSEAFVQTDWADAGVWQ